MSPVAQALYFGTLMHITGIIGGWHYHKWFNKKKLPKPLEGDTKTLAPPNDAPKCLSEAFWAGSTSDYLNKSVPHNYWTNACIAYRKEF
jgi:hypothetical protein